ncbi:hypothetical protein AGABI2DRAFT_143213 [Agaricus bisporus var. bisporus H97]|uniref:hypothetical protein n=1 Tax=Agaricus bisporus var. bisporus (strain H97 / ATCC MYA-4626 / FGSC 10389) TaxID=936046 RepID=UPI00029F7F93|nr:hypothetical protein AGABI2DRAFT_143213 [Agaricus bisporus var. bisporus H97]EKV47611.1 hypothetical protein AGABI2DRAFT_143213 [Agaricus bisporus var. bisporus H97]
MAASQLSLSLNQILASDAPVLSPVSPDMPDFQWDIPFYAHAPPSPPSSSASPLPPPRMLKARTSPDPAPDACVPTHQLFDLNAPPSPVSSLLSADSPLPMHSEPAHSSNKRSASPSPAPAKKPRAQGERIASKDFIPPDVTGLTKREARLVKNRAAAFLSRQRKREEFESMEHRVTELENENARLLALTQAPEDSNHLASEVEQLKAELAAARNRERELNAQLATRPCASPPPAPPVKLEASDSFPLSSPARTSNVPFSNKSGASLGLMVLLCALPSLLSMPLQSTSATTSFTVPTPLLPMASSFDINSYLPNDYDWSRPSPSSIMDLDSDVHHPTFSSPRRLEFSSDIDTGALGNLDISFDTTPSENGKIRVRIHPASSDSSRAPSPGASSSASSSAWDSDPFHSDRTYAAPSPSSASSTSAFSPISASDPFFGISGPGNDYGLSSMLDGSLGMLYGAGSPPGDTLSSLNFPHSPMAVSNLGLGNNEFSIPDPLSQGQKRRVRIALKSMPQAGGAEGGEWEVQLC